MNDDRAELAAAAAVNNNATMARKATNAVASTDSVQQLVVLLGQSVGRGAFGCVYECTVSLPVDDDATDAVDQRLVLKKFGASSRDQFNRERQFYERLASVASARVGNAVDESLLATIRVGFPKLYASSDGGRPTYALLFANAGVNLHAYCSSAAAPPSLTTRARLLRDVVKALRVVHAVGYAHGDVKPKNVLVSCGGGGDDAMPSAKLCDFGLCERLPTTYRPSPRRCGTLAYMSVDAHVGAKSSARSDVESFAWCAYETLLAARYLPWRRDAAWLPPHFDAIVSSAVGGERRSGGGNKYDRALDAKLAFIGLSSAERSRQMTDNAESIDVAADRTLIIPPSAVVANLLELCVDRSVARFGLVGPEMNYGRAPAYDEIEAALSALADNADSAVDDAVPTSDDVVVRTNVLRGVDVAERSSTLERQATSTDCNQRIVDRCNVSSIVDMSTLPL